MKRLLTVGVVLASFLALSLTQVTTAQAQQANATGVGQAQSASQSASGSSASNSLIFNTPSGTTSSVNSSGTTTLKTAPPVQAPSMGSGHPCGLATSGGISIIGGGLSGGGSYVDEACLLAQMGPQFGQAAIIMIAARDEGACKALRQTGKIAPQSACTQAEKRAAAKAQKAAAKPVAASSRSVQLNPQRSVQQDARAIHASLSGCNKMMDGSIRIKYRNGKSPQGKAACLASLGY